MAPALSQCSQLFFLQLENAHSISWHNDWLNDSQFLPLEIWGQNPLASEGVTHAMSLLEIELCPFSLKQSQILCLQLDVQSPSPGRQQACFFSQIHKCLYPWQFYRGLKSLFNWNRNSESFLTFFGKREVLSESSGTAVRFVWAGWTYSLTFCPDNFAVSRWRKRMVKLWMLRP